MSDGFLNKCIECTKKDVKNRYDHLIEDEKFHESEKARHRDKYYRLDYRTKYKPTAEEKKIIMTQYRKRYPEKYLAQNKSQRIPHSLPDMEFHHWSYNEGDAKDVIELSTADHNLLHRHMKYDTLAKMFRRRDTGELLDTKDKHMQFLFQIVLKHVLS